MRDLRETFERQQFRFRLVDTSRHYQTLVDTSRQIVTWTAFAILAMFKICFKEDEAQSVVQRFFGQKQFKGTVPQIREVFFVSVNFFWFEMARGEFSRYFRVKYLYLR